MADAIEELKKSISEFTEKTRLINIMSFDFKQGNNILEDLLKGHSVASSEGVGIYYLTEDPKKIKDGNYAPYIKPFIESYPKNPRLSHPICEKYRAYESHDKKKPHDEKCIKFDKEIVKKYYTREWTKPTLYRCHLKIWEMTSPLTIDGVLLGVLFTGQLVVKGDVKWDKALEEIEKSKDSQGEPTYQVCWNPYNTQEDRSESSNQIKDIEEAIKGCSCGCEADANCQKQLIKIAKKRAPAEKNIEPGEIAKRFEDFINFRDLLIRLLEELHTAKKEAVRREHIHESSKNISIAGDRLTEEPEQFWKTLDKVVKDTLPDVKGYVFYNLDKYNETFEPVQTCIYDNEMISQGAGFRNFCKYVFDDLQKKKKDLIIYNLSDKSIPETKIFRDLFQRAVGDRNKVTGRVSAIAIPLAEHEQKIIGGLVCLCVQKNETVAEKDFSESSLKFYVDSMKDITDILSMVISRHRIAQERAESQTVRSHELVAPVHAIRSYYDNLSFMFTYDIVKDKANKTDIEKEFEKQLRRLGDLCELLGLIAMAYDTKSIEKFRKTTFARAVIFPVVPPLNAYAKSQKNSKLKYDGNAFLEMPDLWISVEGIKRCLFNLVFNAIKYCDKSSIVNVGVDTTPDAFKIWVANRGIGVPSGEEKLIFRMFKQGSNADTVAAYGSGLGLYVARLIARRHGGDVELEDGSKENTKFTLILPHWLEHKPAQVSKGE